MMTSQQSDDSSFFDDSSIICEVCRYTDSLKISAFYLLEWLSYARITVLLNF